MRIYHLALESEWQAARRSGTYTTSTVGRSLAEEGFIHACFEDQLPRVSDRFYREIKAPLVKLTIDTDKLTSEVREEEADGETYPHIYGPLNTAAVVGVMPWHRSGREGSVTEVFARETMIRLLLAIMVMALAYVGAALAPQDIDGAPLLGALLGMAVGALIFWQVLRRRATRH